MHYITEAGGVEAKGAARGLKISPCDCGVTLRCNCGTFSVQAMVMATSKFHLAIAAALCATLLT